MAANSGGIIHGLRGVIFDLRYGLKELVRLNKYTAKEEYFSIVRLDDETFTLRSHDEVKEGGYRLVAECIEVAPALPPLVVAPGDALPTEFVQVAPLPEYIFIDVQTGGSNVDLAGWLPTGVGINQRVQIRKADTGSGRISYPDPYIPYVYTFVDKVGEFITLLWTGAGWHII